jgi:hypothetical protein
MFMCVYVCMFMCVYACVIMHVCMCVYAKFSGAQNAENACYGAWKEGKED